MSNTIQIRRGETAPNSNNLAAYELGFMTEGGKLYIGLENGVKMLTAGPSSTLPKAPGTASTGSEDNYSRGDHIHPLQTSVSGNAGTATKLASSRTIQVDLASTAAASFDGTENITPGITGILPVSGGGTGGADAATARANLDAAKTVHSHSQQAISPVSIELTPTSTTAGHGGYIDFHYNASTSDYTSRIIESSSGTLSVIGKLSLNSPLSVASGGTGATTAANACTNLGAVKKSGDTMTGTLVVPALRIDKDAYPMLYFANTSGTQKGAIYSLNASATASGGIVLRGFNADATAYKDLVLSYATGMVVPIGNGGTGASSAYTAVQNLFDVGTSGITTYPTKPGIYRTVGTNVCTNSGSTLSGYGVLVIFKMTYGLHIYIDSNSTIIMGYSGDTFGQPTNWRRLSTT